MAFLTASVQRQPISSPAFVPDLGYQKQRTISQPVQCEGIGVHSGAPVSLKLIPALPNQGIFFVRTDLDHALVPASWKTVVDTRMCTTVGNKEGATVSTIEHLMAALAAAEIDNLCIEINGPELPIMDGSSVFFANLLEKAGLKKYTEPRRVIKVLKPVSVGEGDRIASLNPASAYELAVEFDFGDRQTLPTQHLSFRPSRDSFRKAIAPARTFGLLEDAKKLRAMGFAQGASLENTVVYDKGAPINAEGTRYDDECARHKILDAMGDLHLAGGLILGKFYGLRAGHGLHCELLRALFANPTQYSVI